MNNRNICLQQELTQHATQPVSQPRKCHPGVKTTPLGAPEEGRACGPGSMGHHSTQAWVSPKDLLESQPRPRKAKSARHQALCQPTQGKKREMGGSFYEKRAFSLIFSPKQEGGAQMAHRGRRRGRVIKRDGSNADLIASRLCDPGHMVNSQSLQLLI